MPFALTARTGHPDFLDLPWDQPLQSWHHERLVEIPAGLHRHVVRFVRYDDEVYVLKELPRRYAEREYRFLRHLVEEGVPAVTAVGVATQRTAPDGEPLEAVLITQHLKYSMPYRLLFERRPAIELRDPMLDALVHLLVRIHLVGFLWGDCSLSNSLFRRDAGRLAAYVVDTETGELHASLTDGQRNWDIETAIERSAGELLDLQAQGLVRPEADPLELADDFRGRYATLWDELTREDVIGQDERYLIHRRLERINELGYDVGELELTGDDVTGTNVRLRLHVVEPGRPRRLLRERTGIDAQDEQARRLLSDIASFGAWLESDRGEPVSPSVIAGRWLELTWERTLAAVPEQLRSLREDPQLLIEILDHWHWLSASQGRDMELVDAAVDYAATVLEAEAEAEPEAESESDGE